MDRGKSKKRDVAEVTDLGLICVCVLTKAMTNGRLVSVRHRAMANSCRPRTSTVFFGAPSPGTRITPLPQMIKPQAPRRYKSFTWAEYKKAMYSLRLGHNRLDLFLADPDHHDKDSGITD
ncbi:hypothetical protein BHE74_00021587 [Ensete ventricosum]|uniref:Uncharacterized protein n=1 Tax=Ensete ventricosum TaxID=4639 RepID=A0A426Z805_ENSVE|nr:hypothetical protein B296_00016123 [Ensete ventricosum]RWW31163.1 hypothetical protein GW17_00004208 [Ensete ventricosum]RWW70728.1 hypothetical protein BHE74_00021587 [Ensete ventricosum]RZR97619.1 hypothetical protein BHM03_00026848 [Ensete ventricosum]